MVKQEMENNVLQQPRSLLRIAIASIFESQRKNPEKLLDLYYNTSPTLAIGTTTTIVRKDNMIKSHQLLIQKTGYIKNPRSCYHHH